MNSPIQPPADVPPHELITLGGGCFWCLEAVYELVDGVLAVESGYTNGHVRDPSYEQVCGGDTGHAEVVQVTFDPRRIGLAEVLEIFFHIHDPTTLNRQGNDAGPQYRSGIYWHEPAQEAVVRQVLAQARRPTASAWSPRWRRAPTTGAPRTTTSTTSPTTPGRAIAPLWWRPRSRSSAAPSRHA